MSLVPSLLQAIVRVDGEALVMHVGEKPYVVSPNGQIDLATRGLTFEAVSGLVAQLLPADAMRSLDEVGATQFELPPFPEFPGEQFTVTAARGGDDVWAEIRRRQAHEDDLVAPDLFAAFNPPPAPVAEAPVEDLTLPQETQLWPGEAAEPVAQVAAPVDDHRVVPEPLITAPEPVFESAPAAPEAVVEPIAEAAPVVEATPAAEIAPAVDTVPVVEATPVVSSELTPVVSHPHEPNESQKALASWLAAFTRQQKLAKGEPVATDVQAEAAPAPEPVASAPVVEVVVEPVPTAEPITVHSFEPAAVAETAPVIEGESSVEAVPMIEAAPLVEATLVAEAAPVTESTPVIDTTPVVESTPVAETPPIADVTPVAETMPMAESEPVVDVAPVLEYRTVAEPANVLAFAPTVEAIPVAESAAASTDAPLAPVDSMAPEAAVVSVVEEAPVSEVPVADAAPVADIIADAVPVADIIADMVAASPAPSVASADVVVSEPLAEVEPPAFAIAHVDTLAESAVSVHSESEADMSTQTPDFNPFATPSAPVDVPVSTRQSAYVPFPSLVDQPQPAVVLPMGRASRESGMSESSGVALEKLVRQAASRGASALFLASGSRPSVRLDGDVQTLDATAVLSAGDIEALLFGAAPDHAIDAVRAGAGEWLWELNDVGSVRCTTFRDSRGPGAVFRIVAVRPQSASQLGLSREIQSLGSETEGLVLVSGPRASGKSTLISSFVDLINRTRRDYVITLESEVNVTHERHGAFISQREVRGGSDEALAMARAALREDPDVLVIDDLRSSGLMTLALDAAANGQLVIGGVPAHHASGAVERLIDLYQPEQRRQVQLSLAQNLRGVVSQVLLRKNGGGRIAAREVLLNTPIVASLLAEGRTTQLPMAIEGGRKSGMVPLNDAFVGFVQSGAVDVREAYRRAADRAGLLELLKRQGIDTSVVERLA